MIAGLCDRGDMPAAVALLREMRGGGKPGRAGGRLAPPGDASKASSVSGQSDKGGGSSSEDGTVVRVEGGMGDTPLRQPRQRMGDRRPVGVAADTVSYNTIINGYAGVPCVASALGVARLMEEEGVAPDRVTFRSVLKACANAGDVREATATIQRMRSRGFPAGAPEVNWLLLAHARARRRTSDQQERVRRQQPSSNSQGWETEEGPAAMSRTAGPGTSGALQLLQEIRSLRVAPDSTTYSLLLYTAAEAGDVVEAATIFGQMESPGPGGAKVTPTRRHWNALLHAATQAGDPQAAASFLSGLETAGVHPDSDSFAKMTRAAGLPHSLEVATDLGKGTGGRGHHQHHGWADPSAAWRQGRGAEPLANLRRLLRDPRVELAPGSRAFLELISAAAGGVEETDGSDWTEGDAEKAMREDRVVVAGGEGQGGRRGMGGGVGGHDMLDGRGEGLEGERLDASVRRWVGTMVGAFGGTPRVAIYNAALGVAVSTGAVEVARHVLALMREEEENAREARARQAGHGQGVGMDVGMDVGIDVGMDVGRLEAGDGGRRVGVMNQPTRPGMIVSQGNEASSVRQPGDARVGLSSRHGMREIAGLVAGREIALEAGCAPLADADTFMLRLSLCAREGDLDGATAVVEEARRAVERDAGMGSGRGLRALTGRRKQGSTESLAPAPVTGASLTWLEEGLARAHLQSGDLVGAFAVVDRMRARGWRLTQGPASQRLFWNTSRRAAVHPSLPAYPTEGGPAGSTRDASWSLPPGTVGTDASVHGNTHGFPRPHRTLIEMSRRLSDELIFACTSAGMSNDDIIERLGLGGPSATDDVSAAEGFTSSPSSHRARWGEASPGDELYNASARNWDVNLRAAMEQQDPEEICAALRGLLHHAGRGRGNAGGGTQRLLDRDVLETLEEMSFSEVTHQTDSFEQDLVSGASGQLALPRHPSSSSSSASPLPPSVTGRATSTSSVAPAHGAISAAHRVLWQDVQYLLWQVEIHGLVEGRNTFAN
eukprot:jgi/Mesvir1/25491/Mv01749-RA.1